MLCNCKETQCLLPVSFRKKNANKIGLLQKQGHWTLAFNSCKCQPPSNPFYLFPPAVSLLLALAFLWEVSEYRPQKPAESRQSSGRSWRASFESRVSGPFCTTLPGPGPSLPSPSPGPQAAEIHAHEPIGMQRQRENTNPFRPPALPLSVWRELVFFYVCSATCTAPRAKQQLTTEPNTGTNNHRSRV